MTTRTLPKGRITRNAVSSRETVDWRLQSSCRGQDPDLFFSTSPADREEAKRVCAGCPVRSQCYDLAVEFEAPSGVWGGEERSKNPRSYGASHMPVVQDILLTRRNELNAAITEGLPVKEIAAKLGTNVQTINNLQAALTNGEVDWQLDTPDDAIVQKYLSGEVRDVHPRERLAAVVQGVREGLTYAHFDRVHGLRANSTMEFVRQMRRMFAAAGAEFPDTGRRIVHRVLSNDQVVQMREQAADGVSDKDLAFQYDVSRKTVRYVVSGRRYKDVGGPLRAPGSAVQSVESLSNDDRPAAGQQDMEAAA